MRCTPIHAACRPKQHEPSTPPAHHRPRQIGGFLQCITNFTDVRAPGWCGCTSRQGETDVRYVGIHPCVVRVVRWRRLRHAPGIPGERKGALRARYLSRRDPSLLSIDDTTAALARAAPNRAYTPRPRSTCRCALRNTTLRTGASHKDGVVAREIVPCRRNNITTRFAAVGLPH